MRIWPWSRFHRDEKLIEEQKHVIVRLTRANKNAHEVYAELSQGRDRLVIIAKGRKAKLKELKVSVKALDVQSWEQSSMFLEEQGRMTHNRGGEAMKHPLLIEEIQ